MPPANGQDQPRLTRWGLPIAAGLAMCIPVPLWDLALERELAQQAIRRACLDAGLQPRDADVVACRGAIFKALASGHRVGWLFNGAMVVSYVGGFLPLSALTAASVSWVTTQIVKQHLLQHPDLGGLTEEVARAAFLSLIGRLVADRAKRTFRSAAPAPASASAPAPAPAQTISHASST
jgi:hypothetical protein